MTIGTKELFPAWIDRWINPVALNELRGRFRGKRAFFTLGVFVGLQVLVVLYTILLTTTGSHGLSSRGAADPWQIGIGIFMLFSFAIAGLICLIVPALSTNAIALEREKKTLAFLELTRLTPWNIVAGKLVGTLLFVLLLLSTTIPILGITFVLGGVSPVDLAVMYGFYALLSLGLVTTGIFASTLFERSNQAIGAAYVLSMPMFFLPFQIWDRNGIMHLLTSTVTWFGREVSGIFIVSAYAIVLVFPILHMSSALLKHPSRDAPTRERWTLTLGFLCFSLLSEGFFVTHGPRLDRGAFEVLFMCQFAHVIFLLFVPAFGTIDRREWNLTLRTTMSRWLDPRGAMGSNALTVPAHACLVMTLQSMLMCALVLYADGSSSKNVMSVLTFEAAILVFVLASAILTTGIAMLVEVISPSRRRVMNVLTGAGLCAFLFLTQISSEFRSGPGVGQRSVLGISSVFYSASPTATLEALDRLGWRFTGSGYSNIRLNERPRDPTWPAADPVDQLTFYLVFWFVVGLLGAASFGLAIKIHSRRVRRLLGGSTW